MAIADVVTQVELTVAETANPRFTPRELRLIREQRGRTFSQILGDEESDERFVVFAWLKLRRDGHELSWDEMDDVVISFNATAAVDPTTGQPGRPSLPSAATGE